MRKRRSVSGLFLCAALAVAALVLLAVSASAADLEWNLLTDSEAGYRVRDMHGHWMSDTEADGTAYVWNADNKASALYIYDDSNILGSYLTFSLEGGFYFDAFPDGIRSGKTPKESPMSFLTWIYKDPVTGDAARFNSIRLDNEGYLYTGSASKDRTDVRLETGRWYNIRCVFTPKSGLSEVFVDGKKAFDFTITKFDPAVYASSAVRYFDGFYSWSARMKNLAVKTDSEYTVEPKRESAADTLGYQTAKPKGGSFDARLILGLESPGFNRVGYEVLILTKDEGGNVVGDSRALRAKEIYETLTDATGKTYDVEALYGYRYAAALEIADLPLEPSGGFFELVLRPYVLGLDGIRRYGTAATFMFAGRTDAEGYPVLERQTGKRFSVTASDDTFVYGGQPDKDNGGEASLSIRNTGAETSGYFRAAYFRFALDARAVKALETATAATLRIYIKGHENRPERKQCEMILQSVGADWDEHSLNYGNRRELAPAYEVLHQGDYEVGSYFTVDILPYLLEQLTYNDREDGTLAVAFRLYNAGDSDAIVAYVSSKESGYAPTIELENSMYYPVLNLSKIVNVGYEPWGYAEHLVNEWFDEIVDKVYLRDENGALVSYGEGASMPAGYGATEATGDFTVEIKNKGGSPWSTKAELGYLAGESEWKAQRFARTLATLGTSTSVSFLETDFADILSEYDVYGGISNAGFKGAVTGFFHTEKIGERVYVIDPLGNPYFALGMNTVDLGYTKNQEAYTLASYGLEEVYFERITRELKDVGVNLALGGSEDELLRVENGLPVVVSLGVVSSYMTSIGRPRGGADYPNNNTINVFDPDFVKRTLENVPAEILAGGYAENPFVFGYTTDNELPSGEDMLVRYLTLDPSEPGNGFSYAAAWTWLMRRTENACPTLEGLYQRDDFEKLNEEFTGFVYAHYYRVAREAIGSVDPNHMYLGSRINGTLYDCEDYHRAACYYLDVITANLYGGVTPPWERMIGFYHNSGKPFLVSEFFAKGADAIDAGGYILANSTGAGILVRTQKDRADYYEHYALLMLESEACVGWSWYYVRDNDQSVFTSNGEDRLIMLHCTYSGTPKANTFMNVETGEILTAAEVGDYSVVYKGADIHSNQNVNKGLYNGDFSSTVVLYEYDGEGNLLGSRGYEIEHPESRTPEAGTLLFGKNGETYTVGRVTNADGGYTETVLTVYRGQYVAFADAIKRVSDHLLGIVAYFDAE
ncbi:MAG: DNRLRE domain-containing protein [Clostridia bacterium]|nr:DNRLRE domain-containing protein [Clostridia bacterium]